MYNVRVLSVGAAKADLRKRNIVLRKKCGEYRVNYLGGKEATAYYTSDITDAFFTGIEMFNRVTRENVDALLDAGELECSIHDGGWWRIRRNGRTRRFKRDPERICIPIKAGLRATGAITERHFLPNGTLDRSYFRRRAPR